MPWRIPEGDLDRVKRQTDLVALVRSRGIELTQHGTKDWVGRCPFHEDGQTPNLIVSPQKGLFHCMACGKAGNAIQFVQFHDGISFRHAYELLCQGGQAAFSAQPMQKQTTVLKLPCPLDPEADDATLFSQVATYYHERLKQSASARAYLASRGLADEELIAHFQLGFADRTLGLRLPDSNRKEGERLRMRLTQLGLWRESGHEHFNGCIVVPLHEDAGNIASLYGRRVQRGELRHLYSPGPHRGLFNRQCLIPPGGEIILCEAVFDALTFYANGFQNVTCLFGTEGFTGELWEALKKVGCVRLAYDADEAGERAAQRDAERLRAQGIEVFRVKFPHGMDANEYGNVTLHPDGAARLQSLLHAAQWLGQVKPAPKAAVLPPTEPLKHVAMVVDELTGDPLPIVDRESLRTGVGWAPEPFVPAPYEQASSLSLAASVSGLAERAAKKEEPRPTQPLAPSGATCLEQRGDFWFLDLEEREYRVAGLEKTLGADALKITLRLRVLGQGSALFYLDSVDLCRDAERRRFLERAAQETGLTPELLKRDLGKVLLALEQTQVELLKPQEKKPSALALSPQEREEALAWLQAPGLIERLREAFHQAGIIGEETSTLVAYLAGVSRKLERPLAIIIQSASAAGKTTLMDAVLSFFPEEERVKYSAMTGQSLYYLGQTNLQHKILAVVEEAGAEKASYALKLLQSEGELTIASTGKDPQTGRMVTQEYRVEGPVMIFLTTTAIDLDEELQNRCLTLTVDETPEQTGRIHRLQRERRTLAGLMAKEERKALLHKLRNAQRLLRPMEVLNPYAPALTFPTGRTRNRRDHEKYLTLIDAIALLHQFQREARPLPNAPEGAMRFIEVSLEDIALANRLAPEVLGRSLDELPPQTRRLLGHIRELIQEKAANGGAKASPGTATFSRRELREACGWSLTQVRTHLERLVELEYLAIRQGRMGSQFVYELLFDAAEPETVAHIGLIDTKVLAHSHKAGGAATLAGFTPGVAGPNGHLAGDGKTALSPATPLAPDP